MMMEASSPLAAMQPPSFMAAHHCGFHADGPTSYASFAAREPFGANSFNFRDLSMKRPAQKSRPDYFNMQPVRGSSPTASLAADLSQNFHIDQSPQLPTPRRALFSTGLFMGRDLQPNVTTPPVPSSSPGALDCMDMDTDMSPLPHKLPLTTIDIQLQSPTPEVTPIDSPGLSIASPLSSSDLQSDSVQANLPPRGKGPLRPSLPRAKGYSTGALPAQISRESRLPPFKFGNYSTKPANSSSLSLSEIFESSPVSEKQQPRILPPTISRSRQGLSGLANSSRNGSPMAGHLRKASSHVVRPRKQFRRSLSMYEHPEDVMRQEKESPVLLPSIMDVETPHVPQLPNFCPEGENGTLPRINKATMIDVLDGKYDHLYEKRVIIDCRFEYEYNGGHIKDAVNFNDKDTLASQLFEVEPTSRALLIFHCEYSAHRAPLMAKFIRNKDRAINADRYPALTYPEAYILDGGYSGFYSNHPDRCDGEYIEMDAKEHALDCERGLGKVKQRSKLVRAQTFAFGQHSPSIDSSPTAMGRSRLDCDMDMEMGLEFTPLPVRTGVDVFRGRAQRMASY